MNSENITNLISDSIKNLSEMVNKGDYSFIEVEEEILKIVNRIGSFIEKEILKNVQEPFSDNIIIKDDDKHPVWYCFKENRNLTFVNRFGEKVSKTRRCYESPTKEKYIPLDEQLGFTNCKGFSPMMTLLMASLGGLFPYKLSSEILSQALGFNVGSTGVQNNAEHIGQIIEENPEKIDYGTDKDQRYDLIVAEVDGTTSPQITEIEGLRGRASLKSPTEYKECNVVVIEKQIGKDRKKIYGGLYSNREAFKTYCKQFASAIGIDNGIMKAFLADGAHHNWDIADEHFPEFIQILDFYHADEHLFAFGRLFKELKRGKLFSKSHEGLLYDGKVNQVTEAMKLELDHVPNRNVKEARREIAYFIRNRNRMRYDVFREQGLPIGSGMIEAACKLVVCNRFKGNGMRWRRKDNQEILRVRLAILNGTLRKYFMGKRVKDNIRSLTRF